MQTTFTQQVKAIQDARELLSKIGDVVDLENKTLDQTLNDAASTIAALKFFQTPEDLVLAAPELLTALSDLLSDVLNLIEKNDSIKLGTMGIVHIVAAQKAIKKAKGELG